MSEVNSNNQQGAETEAPVIDKNADTAEENRDSDAEMSSPGDRSDRKQEVRVENTNRIESETSSSSALNDGSSDSSNPTDNANSNDKDDSLEGSETGNDTDGASKSNKKKLDRSKLRKGKWTTEEEEYTAKIIHYFRRGVISLPQGATLRSYLAEKLNCDPMRVTKKYAAATVLGRRFDHFIDRKQPTVAELQMARVELDHFEQRFRSREQRGKGGSLLPPRTDFIFTQPQVNSLPFVQAESSSASFVQGTTTLNQPENPIVSSTVNTNQTNPDLLQTLATLLNPQPQAINASWPVNNNLPSGSNGWSLPTQNNANTFPQVNPIQTPQQNGPAVNPALAQILLSYVVAAQAGNGSSNPLISNANGLAPHNVPLQQSQPIQNSGQIQSAPFGQQFQQQALNHSSISGPVNVQSISQSGTPHIPPTAQGLNPHVVSSLGGRTPKESADGNMLLGFLSSLRNSYEQALKTKADESKKQEPLTRQSLNRHKNQTAPVVSDSSGESMRNQESSMEDSDWNSDKKTDPSSSEDSDKEAKSEDSDKEGTSLPGKGPPRKRLKTKGAEKEKPASSV